MCRFLLAKSRIPFKPSSLLYPFAKMVQKSKAYDGDWQGDGWGMSWFDNKNVLHEYRSLQPLWKDQKLFDTFTLTPFLSIHARSASFPQDKGDLSFNQPYTNNTYSFVFNGLLRGVTLNMKGKIGAQKIWNLLKIQLHKNTIVDSLQITKNLLITNSKEVQALNIGVGVKDHIYALCYYTKHPSYYKLRYVHNSKMSIISSEPVEGYSFQSVESGTILSF